jgi:hemoglobin
MAMTCVSNASLVMDIQDRLKDARRAELVPTTNPPDSWNAFAALRVLEVTQEVTMRRVLAHASIGIWLMFVLAIAAPAAAQSAARPVTTQPAAKSLYERLGGVYSIASVVDDFIERLLINDVLNANPAIKEARGRVPKAGLKFHVTTLVCEVTGGPCKYTGRTMKESHTRLNINEAQWDAMVVEFRKTLDRFKVPSREQQELITIVGSTKKDIVK